MKSEFFNVRLTPETEVVIQIIHLLDSAFVYVGGEDGKLSNATDKIPTTFTYLAELDEGKEDATIENMTKILCKKTGKVIHLSVNFLPNSENDFPALQTFLLEKLTTKTESTK